MISAARKPKSVPNDLLDQSTSALLSTRVSRDLVIGLMGPVGSGLPIVATSLENRLKIDGYEVKRIKISDFLKQYIDEKHITLSEKDLSVKYLANQTAGNHLREKYKNEILAEYAINKISRFRLASKNESGTKRMAFIIDQLKHQDEIKLLRLVYRNNFYALGVMSLQEQRLNRLKEEGLNDTDVGLVISRDRKESNGWGQQLEKAFKNADYYIQNQFGKSQVVDLQIDRFISLIHGSNEITPTVHEHAMYMAYSTGVKSACLSRQVGAAICDKNGKIIAVGANDVPKSGGGLYSTEAISDERCYKYKRCVNKEEKDIRLKRISDTIKFGISEMISKLNTVADIDFASLVDMDKFVNDITIEAQKSSGISDLIEFSRAVHAEMDALISISRSGGGATQDGILYTTTFPCHNCARHIIAAGIKKVYYIEPYEKSLAIEAHGDAIAVIDFEADGNIKDTDKNKVHFIHFSGAAPLAYLELFSRDAGRKNDAGNFIKFIEVIDKYPEKAAKEYRDSYLDFELKVAGVFDERFLSSPNILPAA